MNNNDSFQLLKTGLKFKDEKRIFEKNVQVKPVRMVGNDLPTPIKSFKELVEKNYIPEFLYNNLLSNNYKEPTLIQKYAIPALLNKRNVIACSSTGSGKTLCFLIPILTILEIPKKNGYRSVIITPTRELSIQINTELIKLGSKLKTCLLDKSKIAGFKSTTSQGFDILISTPKVIIKCIENKYVDLSKVELLILDEGDRLLNDDFIKQTDTILSALPNNCQKAVFTATLASTIQTIIRSFMLDPIKIIANLESGLPIGIQQKLIPAGTNDGKLLTLRQIIIQGIKPPVLIFTNTIESAQNLYKNLYNDPTPIDMIHSKKSLAERSIIMKSFRSGKIWILITTDLLTRGIDFKGVNTVINYDVPLDIATYIHRVGRTGRNDRIGSAITLFTYDDWDIVKSIAYVMKMSGDNVPNYMLSLPKKKKMD